MNIEIRQKEIESKVEMLDETLKSLTFEAEKLGRTFKRQEGNFNELSMETIGSMDLLKKVDDINKYIDNIENKVKQAIQTNINQALYTAIKTGIEDLRKVINEEEKNTNRLMEQTILTLTEMRSEIDSNYRYAKMTDFILVLLQRLMMTMPKADVDSAIKFYNNELLRYSKTRRSKEGIAFYADAIFMPKWRNIPLLMANSKERRDMKKDILNKSRHNNE